MPSQLALKKVTLYKNHLGFFERSAPLSTGNNEANAQERQFTLEVPLQRKGIVVDTLSCTAGAGDAQNTVIVKHDSEAAELADATQDEESFAFAIDGGIADFLNSCVGAEVSVTQSDGLSLIHISEPTRPY